MKRENDQLVAAARAICLASKDNRLATLTGETERLAPLVHGGRLEKQIVLDRMIQAANAYSLVEDYGLEFIE